MKKITIQLVLILCVIVESVLVFKMMESPDIIYQEFYAGLAILVLLTIIRLIHNLTDITYGNPEEN
ncbi:hypothetical protein [Flavobacterium cheniae]|uniref:Uncharacterized protein n=1 Tax=Flavobacterium cheniae TaxID=295428 RepID=A0A562KS85_9FLAO|nr:hypothetical protein [Flavobacterium cheniae]TDR25699.1 hypothetical protein C8D80_0476 [Flavobacterium cheniae]TWH98115.1 hypothetical protein IP97_00060 [Flavobacterium cheniae]